jgi:hypothetical protein
MEDFPVRTNNMRIWAMLSPDDYEKLLIALASKIKTEGRKIKIGDFVAQAVIEKLEKEQANATTRK